MARNFQRYAALPMTRVLRLGHNSTHGGSVLTLAGKDAVAAFFTPFGSAMEIEELGFP